MIDIEKAKETFNNYTSNYDNENENIKRKILHTNRVVDCCKYIAEKLGLNENEIRLAMLIGLLHDIGRFEQLKLYNTYSDHKSIDHAKLGVNILFDSNLIKEFVDEDKYNKIILKAVLNHNKIDFLKEDMNEEELMFCNIIRDADKLDNMYIATKDNFMDILKVEDVNNEIITDKIFDYILNHKLVILKDVVTNIDFLMVYLGYIFDLNYKCSYEFIKKSNYIDEIINRVNSRMADTNEKLLKIKTVLKNYVNDKLFKC
jgi:putative nucleotidyltransferase with HDIG domain